MFNLIFYFMAKKATDFAGILQKYSTKQEFEMHDVGIDVFNELWGGGIVLGFMYGFYATPGAGKTTICLQMIRKRLKDGWKCLIVDVEKSINDFQLNTFGLKDYVDNGQLVIATVSNMKEYEELMMAVADSNEFQLVLVDSVTAIQPYVAKGLTVEDIRPGLRALQISAIQNKIKSQFYMNGITSFMIFQARANLDMTGNPYAPKEKSAAAFNERHLLDVETKISTSSQIKDEDGEGLIGNKIWIVCEKNKFCAPFQKRQSSLLFGKGILRRIEIVDRAIEKGVIVQRGSFFIVPGGDDNVRGRKALYELPSERLKVVQQALKDLNS